MEAFKTTDGRLFPDLTDAQQHQIALDLVKIFETNAGGWVDQIDRQTIITFCKANVSTLRFAFAQLEVTG